MGKYTLYNVDFRAKTQGKMLQDIAVTILYALYLNIVYVQ